MDLARRLGLLFMLSAAAFGLPQHLIADDRMSNCFKFIAGMGVSVFGIHEGGHTIAALALGYPMSDISYRFSSVEIDGLAVGTTDDKIIKMSGFAAQAISTEIILDVKAIPKDSWFVAGILAANILQPLVYVARSELGFPARDFEGFSTQQKRTAEALILGYALLSAYRVYKNPDFPIRLTSSGRDIMLTYRKTFD